MNTLTSSVYDLEFNASGDIQDANYRDFDSASYSRMKHGSRSDTKLFAREIADVIVQDMPEIVDDEQAPLFLVAYKAVQPACGYLSRYALDGINRTRVEKGLEPGEIVKVYKGQVTANDYAKASAAERQAELNGIDFSLQGTDIFDRTAVVLDDIRISGGAERRILEVIEQSDRLPTRLMLGYVALFNPHQAAQAPHVESEINTVAVQSVNEVAEFMTAGNFDLNIRTLKLILGSDRDDLVRLAESVHPDYLEDIVRGATDTGPEFILKYIDNYAFLSSKVGRDKRILNVIS